MHHVGFYRNLRITTERPQRTLGRGGADWNVVAGKSINYIMDVNTDDKMYRVRLAGGDELWLDDSWVVALPQSAAALQDWRDASLSENARQMAHAAAYQRMLWRELGGAAVKRSVGDQVRIKDYRGIRAGFPDAFDAIFYATMHGRKGTVIGASRHLGADGRMYRTYEVRIHSNAFHYSDVWYTGDDLE